MTVATITPPILSIPRPLSPKEGVQIQRTFMRHLIKLQSDLGNLSESISFGDTSDALLARYHIRSAGRVCEPLLDGHATMGGRIKDPAYTERHLAQIAGDVLQMAAMLAQMTGNDPQAILSGKRLSIGYSVSDATNRT